VSAVVPVTISPQQIPAKMRSAVSVTPTVSPAKPLVKYNNLLKITHKNEKLINN
jgi:hypothetical protein